MPKIYERPYNTQNYHYRNNVGKKVLLNKSEQINQIELLWKESAKNVITLLFVDKHYC